MAGWPDGFLWGTGASSTQCEGASAASDWLEWERAGRAPASGDGNGFAVRFAEDFTLYASLGLTHHRLSLDWARLEPEPGVHDPTVVARYRTILQAARDAGITPWVCVHHFTLPRWVSLTGGFANESNRTGPWSRHVRFVADTFGDLVQGWKPINEPNLYAALGYRFGMIPPGRSDADEQFLVLEQVLLANAEAAVVLRQTGAPVASIFGLSTCETLDDDPATRSAADRFYATMWDPWVGLQRDGQLRLPGRTPVERPELAAAFDLIGFSYYFTLGARAGALGRFPDDQPISPLGYAVWADGVGLVLDRIQAELPGAPILVCEYGIGTDDDAQRADYITRGLATVHDAIDRGMDVRGFFHWTGVDNYEWGHGFDVRFGIIDAGRNPRPSARILRDAAVLGTVPTLT